MLAFVIVLQVVVALFLIGVVLLQPGNRGGASAAMGGAGSDTVFGARGANTFLSKITFGAAVCFMLTNLLLSFMFSHSDESKISDALSKEAAKVAAPAAVPETAPAPTEGIQQVAPSEEAKPTGEPVEPANQAEQPEAQKAAAPVEPAAEAAH